MKILWITNITFPEVYKLLGKTSNTNAGGWMLSSANSIATVPDVKLAVASVCPMVSNLTVLNGEHITYYVLPYGKGNIRYNKDYEKFWVDVRDSFNPDVVHIHGTEFTHGLSYVRACGTEHVVVSIQGLLHVIKNYSTSGLRLKDIICNTTIRDILTGSGILSEKRDFEARSVYEIELLRKVSHIIGRTTWDKAHTWAINKSARYYNCNESLRGSFYEGSWSYEKCNKHTIFLSQGSSALKGAHFVFKALPLILEYYPDTQVRIAGADPTAPTRRLGFSLKTGYGQYLTSLIKSLGIESHIKYLGNLSEFQMKEEYLRANVFICPSSIENSPNSLGEAQILGTPCIASYVGGVPDFVPNSDYGIVYRFDDIELLSKCILSVFDRSANYVNTFSIEAACRRHDRIANTINLLDIYKKIEHVEIT